MQVTTTQVAAVTLQSGQSGLRVVFCGEGDERIAVEMVCTDGATADADTMAQAEDILLQTALFGLTASEYIGQIEDHIGEATSDSSDALYLFEYRGLNYSLRRFAIKFPSLEAARDKAVRFAMELLLTKSGNEDLTGWLVRVSDESGQLLFTIDISEEDARGQCLGLSVGSNH